ncbi:MAG TPA: 2,3-bisphosphoglycerate-independent phosphoglycerate mutase, partial [Syntrophobacteraceae bacterium]|nr:2,3-bisphosphoglycerate-independent phosphoglycerate mutase [Syntrophobacteraceae bacterium]
MHEGILKGLLHHNEKKIVLLVIDGLGGLPAEKGGQTELETARTPNLDQLAEQSECGLHVPVGLGITPGSAPGHLALFGYQPTEYTVGRGVVAAMGIGFPLKVSDVAARLNFATRDGGGRIVDRRAGRIATETCSRLCELLGSVCIPGVQVFVRPVKDYRAVVVFRGEGLSSDVEDTDPQATGVEAYDPKPASERGIRTAEVAKEFIRQSLDLLKDQYPANAILMRGFAELPLFPSMTERFGLHPVALAVYPDYKGVSRLVGMDVVDGLKDLKDQAEALKQCWDQYDFFFIHHKYADSRGEDGDFLAKVAEIEKVDAFVPQILNHHPDVLVVTGDHSTPAVMKSHSHHPIPFLIHGFNM